MTYQEFEEKLLEFNKVRLDRSASVSHGPGHQSRMAVYKFLAENRSLPDTKENFELVTRFLEEHCPNTFNIMISTLDSNPDNYETLYDLLNEVGYTYKNDGFVLPPLDYFENIRIYR